MDGKFHIYGKPAYNRVWAPQTDYCQVFIKPVSYTQQDALGVLRSYLPFFRPSECLLCTAIFRLRYVIGVYTSLQWHVQQSKYVEPN